MSDKQSPFRARVLLPDLPKPDHDHEFRYLQAASLSVAVKEAIARVFRKGNRCEGKNPRTCVVIVDALGDQMEADEGDNV